MGTLNTDQTTPHACIKNFFFLNETSWVPCSLPVKNDIKTWSRKESTSKSEETSLQIMHDTWFIYNVFLIKNPFLEAILLTSLIKTHFCLIWNQEQKKKKNQCSQANHWCYGQRLHKVYHGWHFILNFPHSCNSHVTPFTLFKKS